MDIWREGGYVYLNEKAKKKERTLTPRSCFERILTCVPTFLFPAFTLPLTISHVWTIDHSGNWKVRLKAVMLDFEGSHLCLRKLPYIYSFIIMFPFFISVHCCDCGIMSLSFRYLSASNAQETLVSLYHEHGRCMSTLGLKLRSARGRY